MNRAELAAIAVALKSENTKDHISILANSSFYINTIRKYTIDPAAYNQHLHTDLLQLTNQLIGDRDSIELKTQMGKSNHTRERNTMKQPIKRQERWWTERPQ